jgi:peptidoglycan-associated lipoprotein
MRKKATERLILLMLVVLIVSLFACAAPEPPPPPPGPTPEEIAKQEEDARKQELVDRLAELGRTVDPSQYSVAELEQMLREAEAEAERKRREEEQLKALRDEEIRLMNEMRGEEFVDVPAKIADSFMSIQFDYDKYNIKDEFKDELQATADMLEERGEIQVLIEGHCDERGTNEYNMGLGERRSLAVRSYLISLGISSTRLHTISYGEERPLESGHNESAWTQNRRVQYKVRVQ